VCIRGLSLHQVVDILSLHAGFNVKLVDVASVRVVNADNLVNDQSNFVFFVALLEPFGLRVVSPFEVCTRQHFSDQFDRTMRGS